MIAVGGAVLTLYAARDIYFALDEPSSLIAPIAIALCVIAIVGPLLTCGYGCFSRRTYLASTPYSSGVYARRSPSGSSTVEALKAVEGDDESGRLSPRSHYLKDPSNDPALRGGGDAITPGERRGCSSCGGCAREAVYVLFLAMLHLLTIGAVVIGVAALLTAGAAILPTHPAQRAPSTSHPPRCHARRHRIRRLAIGPRRLRRPRRRL